MHEKKNKTEVLSAEFLQVPLAAAETSKMQISLTAAYFSIFKFKKRL